MNYLDKLKRPVDWLAEWRRLAELTSGISSYDPRLPVILEALNRCDDAFLAGDFLAFKRAATRVEGAMKTQ
jgi:hypothetical protein